MGKERELGWRTKQRLEAALKLQAKAGPRQPMAPSGQAGPPNPGQPNARTATQNVRMATQLLINLIKSLGQ